VQFRFVATDANPAQGGVEAAIDDLAVTSMLASCSATATPARRLRLPPGRPPSAAGTVVLLMAVVLRRRRRTAP
jgi:hypothetical protein